MSDTDKPERTQDESVRAFRSYLDRMETRQRLPVAPLNTLWKARRKAGLKNVLRGFALTIIGIIVTFLSYKWSKSSGDRLYIIFGSVIACGVILFFGGIFQVIHAYFQRLLARKP